MKYLKTTIYAFLITIGIFATVVSVRAAINPMLNFTGKVTETDGSELADGNYDMSFRLFASSTGGAAVWSEDLTGANLFSGTISTVGSSLDGIVYSYGGGVNESTLHVGQYLATASGTVGALIVDFDSVGDTITVASSSPAWSVGAAINNRPFVEGGVINVDLGAATDLSNVDFDQILYLEVVFNGETMQPRKMYNAVPYAFNAMKLGGLGAESFAALGDNEIVTGQWNFADILTTSATSAATTLTVIQNGSGKVVEFLSGTTTAFAVLNDGRVQIGDYFFPTAHGSAGQILKTDASGNLYWAADFASSFGSDGKTLWATSSDSLLIYPIDTSYITVLGNNATTTLNGQIFEVNGSSLFDTISISGQQQLRFYDADSSNYMAIRATGTMVSNFVLTLPADVGTGGQALLTDGNGNLTWGSPSGFVYASAGTSGQFAYYAANGSQVTGTSSIIISPSGYIGIGTTTPLALLSIGNVSGSQILINASGQIIDGTWLGDAIADGYIASAANWNNTYTQVNASSTYWNQAYLWGNHAAQNYFSTSSAQILEVAFGGTGANSLNNLIALGINTTGNYISSTTGSNTITITGTPGEGWVPVFSVTNDSITASKLAVGSNGTNGYVLTSDGDGTFSWNEAGASSGFVKQSFAGQLAFYVADGIVATGTTGLYWDNGNTRLGIGTTTPGAALSVGSTVGNQFLVNASGIVTDGTWQGEAINDDYIASSTYWNAAYQARIINTTAPITFSGNTIGLDGLYNIPLIASTTEWNNAYNWGPHAGLYDVLGQATSTLALHTGMYDHVSYDDIVASSTWYNWAYNTVNTNYAAWNAVAASSTYYNQAYNWGNHALENYFSTSSARILEVTYGGTGSSTLAVNGVLYGNGTSAVNTTGQGVFGMILMVDSSGRPVWVATSSLGIDFDAIDGIVPISQGGTGSTTLDDLIILGTHTVGNYISSTTGSDTITITGTPGEGWIPIFSVTDDSISEGKLNIINSEGNGLALISNGDGTFRWEAAGASSGYVKEGLAGQLAFYATNGISATGTTGLFWDNGNMRLGIGTTTPGAALSVGSTIGNQFLVNASGVITDGTWNGDSLNDEFIASSTYWNAAYFGRVTSATVPLSFSGNTIGLDGLYNIPLIASTTEWNNIYNIVNSKYANWDAVAASSTFFNTNSNIVSLNYLDWNAVVSSSSLFNWAYNTVNSNYADWNSAFTWGNHAGLYDVLGQATSTLTYHTGMYDHASYDDVVSSSTFYNTNSNIVATNYANWNNAFDWGDHSTRGYFSTSSGYILEIANGGTGANSLNNLVTLGTHTVGSYISSTTGSNTITITGTPGEGWVPVFSVTDDSITATKLAMSGSGAGNLGQVLIADGNGTFSWSDVGTTNGTVREGFAGQLAFYSADGMSATGTTNLYWDNDNYRLGIGTTTPGAALSVGATIGNQFLVNASGIITDGTWNGDTIDDGYVASSTYWNAAYLSRITSATAPLSISGNTIGLDGLYNIPLIASTTEWNNNYNLVNSKYANWDDAFASSTFFNTNANIVNNNYLAWNAVVSSSTLYDWAYNTVNSNYLSWNAVAASSTWYNWAYNTVNSKYAGWDAVTASSTYYNQAYNWGDHALENYFSTSTSRVLEIAYGGTGMNAIASGSIVYASSENTLSGLPIGEEGEVLIVSGGELSWASTSPAAAHNILSVIHGDAEATGTLVRGDLMVVNSNTKWSRLQLGPAGYILFSDGTDTRWATTTSITALGAIVQGSWMADTIAIAYGGTGATTATGVRENLDLDEIYEFGINSTGTAGWLWQSDGDGRGQWIATTSLGIGGGGVEQAYSKFIGTTTATTDGHFATGTLDGYAAGNAICDNEYPGSYFCRTYDILVTVEQDNISEWGTANADAWIAQGPPGFTDNSNDCNGWNTNDIDYLGAFWVFNGDTGGYGKLVNCTQVKPLACCKWQ
ncbi:MAG: hypothetical protein US83_C0017G0002 [Candidatus Falkowbacteria bacterium GW2011_GWC2_38_22]|uniref:Uncharacterized protein n=1 Tax=Candidatus Falkowbacteria bacterium GW2011_GWE1_38_31 TaxID=1618638 RepID=A0A0G0M760_9BACT|nr:MAG: hypothetical protein US73_C0015G0002 [Candidatus Falkowbacteria bacterium GW2011_GWF2_38_1205]KKQ60480.1 MAG: hypothetical protein US83_C0017G0002 [Candidatus Falkowbacteria bacterium GW2011_GWC2_38_22]KKQ62578.1 MAG: hypothetical protein US84_C0014G0002 [Candidatus Falkowbacteria bacterium GW2011_GWF1_38_22]KKQ64625.1 MAG: hypothetical protein US87_C0014G0002 [Candidatus Falkowbacteria bacterium GW2011_GWE2_38_254]KKQ69534.1 MAG: hypothetical protein US91_C0013G0002 [Candidatus Falkowb